MPQSPDAVARNLPPPPLVGRYPQGFNPFAAPADQRGAAPVPFGFSTESIAQRAAAEAYGDPRIIDKNVYIASRTSGLNTPILGGVKRLVNFAAPSLEDQSNPLFAYGPTGELSGPTEAIGAVAGRALGAVRDFSPTQAAGSFAESLGQVVPQRVSAGLRVQFPEEGNIAGGFADRIGGKSLGVPGEGAGPAQTAAQRAGVTPRYVAEQIPSKTGTAPFIVRDTVTGEQLPPIFAGANKAEAAAADAARRNAHVVVSDGATAAATVVPPSNALRDLTTPQLTALHQLEGTTAADKGAIEALLGERAFAIAPDEKIRVAASLFDRDVATNIRRAQRGIDTDLSGVKAAIDAAIKDAKVEPSDVNRAAVLQRVMDDQAAANARNPAVNGSRGGGGGKPPVNVTPPPGEPPVPPEVAKVVGQRGPAREVYESIRSLKSFIDVATGRQGIRVVGNPVAFAKSAVATWKGYKSGPKLVTRWLEAKKADPLYDTIVNKMKVELTDAEGSTVKGAGSREEAFPGGAIEQVPVLGGAIQHSNAAYTHGLNVARWEKARGDLQQAEFLWKHLFKQSGPLPDAELIGLGRNVNVATGRGQLGRLGVVGNELGTAFFSPRNTISWPQFFTDWARMLKEGKPVAAALQAKTLVGFLGFSIAALKAHEIVTGQPVETDPRSSDFLKVVDGDQRTDIMGGGQQWMVALARLATGETKDLAGKTAETTPADVLGAFVLNRSHPALGTALSASDLAITTGRRAVEGKPFTGTAKDPQGSEYGILETLLGAVAPMVAAGFLDAVRFEMNVDHKSLTEAMKDVAPATAVQLLGFGGGRYRAGVKTPPLGGAVGSSTPETPLAPEQVLLTGNLQKQQTDLVEKAKAAAKAKTLASPEYLAASSDEKYALLAKASADAAQVASKSFGLNLALNGHPDESRAGALIAWSASPSNIDRARLLGVLDKSGKATAEVKAAIDAKRRQTDPLKPNYDLSADEYIAGSKLVDAWLAAPQFDFGNQVQWDAAARGAELLRKTIADDERRGVKPADDPHIDLIYGNTPYLADFYTKSGSRIAKFVSQPRQAIERNRLWSSFADGARKIELPK